MLTTINTTLPLLNILILLFHVFHFSQCTVRLFRDALITLDMVQYVEGVAEENLRKVTPKLRY